MLNNLYIFQLRVGAFPATVRSTVLISLNLIAKTAYGRWYLAKQVKTRLNGDCPRKKDESHLNLRGFLLAEAKT